MRKLSESLWADIQNQASGQQIKKEDEVDRLDLKGFYEYLKKRYKPIFMNYEIELYKSYIQVPMLCGRTMAYMDIPEVKYAPSLAIKKHDLYPEMLSALKSKYSVSVEESEKDWVDVLILPMGGKGDPLSNSFYIEIIDFILDMDKPIDNMLEMVVNESLWADVQNQAAGETIKKEDDVDLMGIEKFSKYIEDRYSETLVSDRVSSRIRTKINFNKICIPLIPSLSDAGYELVYNMGDEQYLRFRDRYHTVPHFPEGFKFLDDKYTFSPFDSLGFAKVFTMSGELIDTNKQVIELIDFIIDNYKGDNLMIGRKVSESLWADIQSQAAGAKMKKEDVFTNIDELKPIDLGGSVLWADDDLRWKKTDEEEDYWFTYLEALVEIKRLNTGWRLPTVEEVAELSAIPYKGYKEIVQFIPNSVKKNSLTGSLVFAKRGFMHKTIRKSMKTPVNTQYYYGWTSDKSVDENEINVFSISQFGIHHTPIDKKKTSDFYTHNSGDWLCVRLVKDKN